MNGSALTGWIRGFAEGISAEDGPTEEQIRRLISVASAALPAAAAAAASPSPGNSYGALAADPGLVMAAKKKGGVPNQKRGPRPDLVDAPVPLSELPRVERQG